MNPVSSLFFAFMLTYPELISGDDDIISTFFKGYDSAVSPNLGKGKPVTIRSSIYVESFGNIEEANMEYKVYTYFRQRWTDTRLAGKLNYSLVIKGGDVNKIWSPDPYCYNARESNMMIPNEEINSYVRIHPNGDISSSKGVTLVASCVMNLLDFPLDSQKCHLKFGSYAFTTDDIVYEWIPGEVAVGNKEMAQFEYKGSELTSNINVFSTGNFSSITVTFSFKRRIGYFLIQVYFPDMFVVMLSWIVFFMEKEDIGNRMALGITTILTIMFLLGSLNGNLPKVSYPKALDWYLLVSFSFVFLSLIECMIVYVLLRSSKKEKKIKFKDNSIPLFKRIQSTLTSVIGSKKNVSKSNSFNNGEESNHGLDNDLEMIDSATKAEKAVVDDGSQDDISKSGDKMAKIANAIDKTSRVLFPFVFVCFNIFYWTYY